MSTTFNVPTSTPTNLGHAPNSTSTTNNTNNAYTTTAIKGLNNLVNILLPSVQIPGSTAGRTGNAGATFGIDNVLQVHNNILVENYGGASGTSYRTIIDNANIHLGWTGAQGPTGAQYGPTGYIGNINLLTINGITFPFGLVGATGATGATGSTGPAGPTGAGGALGYYGSFYGTTGQSGFSVRPTNYTLAVNQTESSNGVSIDPSGNGEFTIANPGVYNIQFSSQLSKTSGGSHNIRIWLYSVTSASDVPWTNTQVDLTGGSNERQVAAWNWFYTVTNPSGETLALKFDTDNSSIVILSDPVPLGTSGPAIPANILTVQQVMYTQLGPTGATGGSPWFNTNATGGTANVGYTGTGYTGDVLIFGNLLVTGGIDPTYLALTPQTSGPTGFTNPLWVDSINGNALRSQNIYMDNPSGIGNTGAYISLIPDNANQIILNDGGATALSNTINYSSMTLSDPGNNINNSVTSSNMSITETLGNITNDALFSSSNISNTQNNSTAQTTQTSELSQGSIFCYANINNGGTEGILSLMSNPNPIFGAYIDYTKNGSGVNIQNYLSFKYNNSEIFRYDTNGIQTANNKTIVLTDGTTTNTINYLGYTTRNTTTNATFYLTFSDASATGTGSISKTANISCNPNTNTITATTFSGALSGTSTNSTNAVIGTDNASTLVYPTFVKTSGAGNKALFIDDTTTPLTFNPSTGALTTTSFVGALTGTATNATNVGITSDNTSGTYYIPFAKTSGNGNKPLFIDDSIGPLTFDPSTATVSASLFNISTVPSTVNVASRFGQVGLVKLQTLTASITGTAAPVDFNLASIFTSAYDNYEIHLSPTTQLAFSAYPSYSLKAFLGTGAPPTTASLFGYEMISSSPLLVSPVITTGATIATTPLLFDVSSFVNKTTIFTVRNVGFANTQSQLVQLTCKSFYSNPGITGTSDRNIQATSSSGTTITGLTIQQGSISVGNNMTIQAIIYGYNQL
jgi:hypothetical protein